MDMTDCRGLLAEYLAQGCRFRMDRIVREMMDAQLAELLGPGDLLIDLAWNIGCTDLLRWCHDHDVLYINTSVELWDPYENRALKDPTERTLYPRHMAIRELTSQWPVKGATAVLEHGANPGLVSHFAKKALEDIAVSYLALDPDDSRAIEASLRSEDFPEIARLLGVRTIHISEIDTQETTIKDDPSVFLNTWSVEGFYEEGTSPAEMGWGTHERSLPDGACEHKSGPRNQICLPEFGIDTFVRTRVPSGDITAMVVRHGEAFTMSDYLTVRDASGTPVYRPTVHYAYCPCPATWRSLRDLRKNGYAEPKEWTILGDDITGGRDELGVLLMGHRFRSWWTGTILSIEEARKLVPHQNATTVQVASAVIAAIVWMIGHPREGVLVPDQLPYKEILETARPYLGAMPSAAIDWAPVEGEGDAVWQFANFMTKPAGEFV